MQPDKPTTYAYASNASTTNGRNSHIPQESNLEHSDDTVSDSSSSETEQFAVGLRQ